MAVLDMTNATEGFNMADILQYNLAVQNGGSPTFYSWLTAGGDDIHLTGSGIDFSNDPPTFGTVTSIDIDLSNNNLGSPDVEITGIPSVDITTILTINDLIANVFGGNDTLNGGGFDDLLNGGSGADVINGGAGDDTIFGGAGVDTLDGGAGLGDLVDYSGTGSAFDVNLDTGVTSFATETAVNFEHINIGDGANSVVGTNAANIINTNGGNDTIQGGGGADTVNAGAGNDRVSWVGATVSRNIDGGADNDTIDGGGVVFGIFATFNLEAGTYDNGGGGLTETWVNFENYDNAASVSGAESVIGSADANEILTGGGNNSIDGGLGADTINSGGGNDIITGGSSVDFIDAGDGDDTILFTAGHFWDNVDGGTGDDTIDASAITNSNGVFDFLAGTINGFGGALSLANVENFIGSDATNDVIISDGSGSFSGGGGNDTITAGVGSNETLDGGTGTDTLDTTPFNSAYSVNMVTGLTNFAPESFTNFENIITGNGDDTITGTAGANAITTNGGNDSIEGGGGADTIDAGAGDDRVSWLGANVSRSIDGNTGDDTIDGGGQVFGSNAHFDLATGTYDSGFGFNETWANFENYDNAAGSGNEQVTGTSGDNVITTGSGSNQIDGGSGHDTIDGGDGNDIIASGAGTDVVDGGTGIDTVDYSAATNAQKINLVTNVNIGGHAHNDTLTNIENVLGSDTRGDDITGTAGNNELYGNGADDFLRGFNGDDSLFGGANNDFLFGGRGADAHDGGSGNDWAMYNGSDGAVALDLATGGTVGQALGDTYTDIERVRGSGFDDTITGDGNGNKILGDDGADIINGAAGKDIIRGGAGNDTLEGGDGNDSLFGEVGADHFVFLDGSDHDFAAGFETDIDKLRLDTNLWAGTLTAQQVVDMFLTMQNNQRFFFDFGDGDILHVLTTSAIDANDLVDDIIIV